MPERLHRHFNILGLGIYAAALLIVSLLFRDHALKGQWMAWGIATVMLFFLMTYCCHHYWRKDGTKTFIKKLFWTAFALRALFVVAIYFYYLKENSTPTRWDSQTKAIHFISPAYTPFSAATPWDQEY